MNFCMILTRCPWICGLELLLEKQAHNVHVRCRGLPFSAISDDDQWHSQKQGSKSEKRGRGLCPPSTPKVLPDEVYSQPWKLHVSISIQEESLLKAIGIPTSDRTKLLDRFPKFEVKPGVVHPNTSCPNAECRKAPSKLFSGTKYKAL